MFGRLFRSRPQKRGVPPRRAVLHLEALETRECLSAAFSLQATTLAGHRVRLSGALQTADPTHASISFSGAAKGKVTPKADGTYSYVTSTASLGSVSAQAQDQLGAILDTAAASISDAAPVVTLSLAHSGRKVVLTGKVADLDAAGRLITFSGVVSGTTTSNGTGSFTFTATPSGPGDVRASTTDPWGLASNIAKCTFSNAAPVISGFQASEGALNYWTFSGHVDDESPAGLIVHLGGLPSLANVSATVQADGSFSVTVQLHAGEDGMATAQTTDWWGLDSEIAYTLVRGS